jgi:hypothetical protein
LHPQSKGLDQNNKPEGHQAGKSSERGPIIITSKNKTITEKQKQDRNYTKKKSQPKLQENK